MPEKNWLGALYLCGGGCGIVLRSLSHYRRRMLTMGRSPEMEGVPAFAPLLKAQAAKAVPGIDAATGRVVEFVAGRASAPLDDAKLIDKALACHAADIRKAQKDGGGYFAELVGDAASDPGDIELAREELRRYG